ncbi:hypothetical protein [Methanosphaerula subterraneus]|uniref:hypothetical protein n=1 Tax=Methanosphaerula subterraneus TaxID=3350244 RepID=UPI003F879D45
MNVEGFNFHRRRAGGPLSWEYDRGGAETFWIQGRDGSVNRMGRRWGSVRRRMTAFTFNREISSTWRLGGLVCSHRTIATAATVPIQTLIFFILFIKFSACFHQLMKKTRRQICRLIAEKEKDILSKLIRINYFHQIKKNMEAHLIRVPALSLSRYSAFDEKKDGKNSYGFESTKDEQNNGGSFSSFGENVMKIAENDEKNSDNRPALRSRSPLTQVAAPNGTGPQPSTAPALTLTQVNPGDYSRKPDNIQVFSYSLKHIKS